VVRAYDLILQRPGRPETAGVFNVASGRAVRIGDLLDRLLSMAKVRVQVRVDPDRLRPARIERVVGDASRLRSLGWAPLIPIEETLGAVLEDRRRAVAEAQV